jgi:hypothetical protein
MVCGDWCGRPLKWTKMDGLACVPLEKIDPRGALYARRVKAAGTKDRLQKLETPLNDVFNLTFAIAPDPVRITHNCSRNVIGRCVQQS